jgi:hypothetical protein
MANRIKNYTFDKTAKTVTFTDLTTVELARIALIVNVTRGITIFDFSQPTATLGGTVGTNILTLSYDTSAMANTDKLAIFYLPAIQDNPAVDPGIQKGAVLTSNASASALNADVVPSTDLGGLQTITLQLTAGATNATLSFQGCNDNSSWQAVELHNIVANGGTAGQGTKSSTSNLGATGTGTATWGGSCPFRYFRARLTAYSSGTATGYFLATADPIPSMFSAPVTALTAGASINAVPLALSDPSAASPVFTAASNMQNAVSNSLSASRMLAVGLCGVDAGDNKYIAAPMKHADSLGIGASDKSKPLGVGLYAELDDASTTAVSEDTAALLRMTKNRSLMVEQTMSFAYINTAVTTTVKASAGFLKSITVNSKGTVASTITIYNNTAGSGAVIGVIDSLNMGGTFEYDVACSTGITLVTTGTVAPDITVAFR